MPIKPWDEERLREAIALARSAREHGNHPFGALLADQYGKVLLSAENSVSSEGDSTAHAENNLVRQACRAYASDFLAGCTLYASTEPCPMCAGAIFWANIRRVVFGLSEESLYTLTGRDAEGVLLLPIREVYAKGKKAIEVIGPLLEAEALQVHQGFWK
jgi:tRNA(Arg) A34 adenosine deaminase TadA